MDPIDLICFRCEHSKEIYGGCKAFPDGIPDEVFRRNKHNKPLKGQKNDLVFKSKLSGRDLFEYHTSRGGEYAQVLGLAYIEKGQDLFAMLEECERTGKHIVATDDTEDIIDGPVTIRMA